MSGEDVTGIKEENIVGDTLEATEDRVASSITERENSPLAIQAKKQLLNRWLAKNKPCC